MFLNRWGSIKMSKSPIWILSNMKEYWSAPNEPLVNEMNPILFFFYRFSIGSRTLRDRRALRDRTFATCPWQDREPAVRVEGRRAQDRRRWRLWWPKWPKTKKWRRRCRNWSGSRRRRRKRPARGRSSSKPEQKCRKCTSTPSLRNSALFKLLYYGISWNFYGRSYLGLCRVPSIDVMKSFDQFWNTSDGILFTKRHSSVKLRK